MSGPRKLVGPIIALMLIAVATGDIHAGPISQKFREWSAQRQNKVRVERPFSHQSTDVNLGRASYTQALGKHLPWRKSTDGATTHQLRRVPVQHTSTGTLIPQ